MPDIRPFRGLVFDAARVGGFEKVVAEPYDKVTEKMREEYLAASPYNIVRVDLPRESLDAKDRYATAAEAWRGWIAKGIVRRAERPALYLYEQGFFLPGGGPRKRRAFVALVEAREHAKGHVLPHERTFREPKADRMALLEAARAHFGMCFLLYEDGAGDVIRALAAAAADAPPVAAFGLADGTTHRIVPVEDPAAMRAARALLAEKTCTIADGHHRYETQIAFRRDHEKKGDLKPAHRYRLAAFVEASDPGLAILPTHRLLPKGVDVARFAEAARPWLEPAERGAARFSARDRAGGRSFRLRPDLDLARELPDVPAAVRGLDVTILHKLVLERGLGIEAGAKEHAVGYVRWPEEGREKLAAGACGCMIELQPTRVEDVIAVAAAGAVMPQKSTDFYPKLLTGLVMNDIEDDLHGG
jgi:uncharacterized protein (DUF1015 family)